MATVDLTCGLCRKRTSEAVSKLCHGCGLPVHLSCAQHVATRDCGFELGFPLPTLYCSSRCYDTDILGGGSTAASSSATTGNTTALDSSTDANTNANANARWSQQVPNEITAALTLKIGDVSRTSRKHLSITTFRFLLSEGFEVFKAKVNTRTTKELQVCTAEQYVREDPSIYIRPGVHSKQAELVELSDRNFETRIRKTFRNFLKRKAIQAAVASGPDAVRQEQFECDIFIYVKKESAVLRRNAASSRGSSARLLSASVPRQATNADVHSNRILAAFMPPHQQQQHHHHHHTQFQHVVHDVEASTDVPNTTASLVSGSLTPAMMEAATVGHKRRLSETQDRDQQLTGASDLSDANSGYKSIRMILNGSVIAVKVNVADLFAALGVPQPAILDSTVPGANVGSLQTDSVV